MRIGSGYYIIGGRATVKALDRAEIFGGKLVNGVVYIPYARQAPIYVEGEAEVDLDGGYVIEVPFNPIPDSWSESMKYFKRGYSYMVIGGVDVGKSGYTLYISNRLVDEGLRVGIIDTDIGQSDLGPPGTIGSAVMERQYYNYMDIPLYNAYFIGDKMPSGHLLQIVVGTFKLYRELSVKTDLQLINTSGFIRGGAAKALKKGIADVVGPDKIFILDREGETRHIEAELSKEFDVIHLEIPKALKPKRLWERRGYRRYYLSRFLKDPKVRDISIDQVSLENTVLGDICIRMYRGYKYGMYFDGERLIVYSYGVVPEDVRREIVEGLNIRRVGFIDVRRLKGLILGLYKGDRFLNIGLLREIDLIGRRMKVLTDVDDKPDRVVFGYVIYDDGFNEVARLRPGLLG